MNLHHGHARDGLASPEYRAWASMKARCLNKNNASFERYGGAGVSVCLKWIDSFEAFLADVGPRPSPKHSIDRFPDRHGNYEPGNVRWATPKEQSINRDMTHLVISNGMLRPLIDVCQELGINVKTMYSRIHRGWSAEKIISVPVRETA